MKNLLLILAFGLLMLSTVHTDMITADLTNFSLGSSQSLTDGGNAGIYASKLADGKRLENEIWRQSVLDSVPDRKLPIFSMIILLGSGLLILALLGFRRKRI